MKEATFSDRSWHYRMARFGDEECDRNLDDICGYTRAVIAGTIWFIVCATVGACLLISTGDLLVWFVVGLTLGFVQLNASAMLAVIVWGALVALLAIAFMSILIQDIQSRHRRRIAGEPDPSPNFISEAYDAFKNKYCFKVKIVRKENHES